MANIALKTSKYDFSMPPSRDSSKSNKSSTDKDYYYYYVYRKKMDPSMIKGPDDLPVPRIFRRKNFEFRRLTGSLNDVRMDSSNDLKNTSPGSNTHKNPNKKLLQRSNSLPDLMKKLSPKSRGNKNFLEPLKKNSKDKSSLVKTKRSGFSSADLEEAPETGTIKGGRSIPALFNLSPKDGLQWSRHTTITKTPQGVIERTINVETRKIKKDGKWVEETLKSLTHTNEKGSTTSTRKASYRNLLPEEVVEHESYIRGDTPPGISPTPDEDPEPEPERAAIKSNKKNPKDPIKKPIKKTLVKVPPKRTPLVAKKSEVVRPKDDPQSFAKEVLAAVNGYRKAHGVEPLTEDEELNKMAEEWAERLASLEKMEHGDKKGLGENIYCKTSSQPWFKMSGEEVVENWYNEVDDHDYDEEPSPGYLKTGHFTQLIWADTKEMGVAYARNKNGHMAFVVSYFSPKGNWIGEFKEKVPPPGGFPKTKIDASPKRTGPTTRRTLPPITSPPTSAEDLKKSSKSKRSKNLNKAPPLPPRNNKFNLHSDRLAETPYIYSPGTRKKDLTRNQNKSPTVSSRNSTAISSNSLDFDRQADTPNNIYSSPKTSRSKASSVQSSAVSSRNTTANSTSSRSSQNSIANTLKSVVESPRKMNEKFAEEFLDAHNKYRKIHNVGTLTLSDKLSEFAQEWAEENAKIDRMDHRDDNEYGENIYRKWSPNKNEVILGSEPVDDWYSEIKEYDFGQEPLDLNCGHFTQIVWADTEEVGVGIAKSISGFTYVVGNYYPPGNYVGQFSRMVPPPE